MANLPEKIARLRELAHNLWWAWNPRGTDLFSSLDPKLWEKMGNNPVRMLETVSAKRLLEGFGECRSYLSLYGQILRQFDEYMNDRTPSPLLGPSDGIKWSSPVAYFSTEYGLHDCLPIYSGGLGTLSGDHLKTASDLNIPLVGIGLLYKKGFFRQVIDKNGAQTAEYPENDLSSMPVCRSSRTNGATPCRSPWISPGRTLFANIWEVRWGASRSIFWTPTSRATPPRTGRSRNGSTAPNRGPGSNRRSSSAWEAIRLLKKLGIRPRVYHINEGHSAFLLFERIAALMTEEGLSFDEASEIVRGSTVFTTHTPGGSGKRKIQQGADRALLRQFRELDGHLLVPVLGAGSQGKRRRKAFLHERPGAQRWPTRATP